MTPTEQLIENTRKACDIVLDNFNTGKITAEVRDEKLKKLSKYWNKYEDTLNMKTLGVD